MKKEIDDKMIDLKHERSVDGVDFYKEDVAKGQPQLKAMDLFLKNGDDVKNENYS